MTVLGWVLVIVGCVLGLIIGIIALLLVGLFTLVKQLDADPFTPIIREPPAALPGAPLTVPISSLVITVKESGAPAPIPIPARKYSLIKKRTP